MNTIDASIPLQAGANAPQMDLGKMLSLYEIAEAAKQKQGIKNVFAKPGNMENGVLTQQGLTELYQTDPEKAIDVQNAQESRALREQQINDAMVKRNREMMSTISESAAPVWRKYNDLLEKGTPPDQAATLVQDDWTAMYESLNGLPPDMYAKIPQRFDAKKLQSAVTLGDQLKISKDKRDESRESLAERREGEAERHNRESEGRLAAIAANRPDPGDTKWQILTDPTNNQQYRYNPVSAQATDLAGKPYTPGGAAKLGGGKSAGFSPEMGSLMGALAEQGVSLPTGFRSKEQQMALYQGILERNAGKSPDEIAKMLKTGQIEFGAQKKETQTAAGVAGKVEVFANEIGENIPLLEDISQKVPRKEWVDLNKLIQMKDEHISNPDLKELKARITSTLNAYDGLAARGGTDKEKREENRKMLLASEGPESFARSLKVLQSEADIAHRSAVKATKVPELEGPASKLTSFDSIEDAHKAQAAGKIKAGDKVVIGGRTATWHDGD